MLTSSEFSSFGGKTSQEHFHAELYHQQFMNMGGIEYNTAPAAYGVYNTPEMYHPLDHINPAMLDPVPYSLSPYVTPMSHYEQQSEFHHIDYEENSNVHIHHVDTNHFQIDSSQSSSDNTVEYNSTTTTTTRGRKAAEPITITSAQKLDRRTLKRLRNRVSASRCRSKKKEWITEMEEANATLHEENTMLQERISELMVSIARAKTQIAANKLS